MIILLSWGIRMKDLLLRWLDRLLVLDVFVVILGFFWFALGLVGELTGLPLGYHLWLALWMPLFQPAIGILMGGALMSWCFKKVYRWLSADAP